MKAFFEFMGVLTTSTIVGVGFYVLIVWIGRLVDMIRHHKQVKQERDRLKAQYEAALDALMVLGKEPPY